jgi:hypothetical protein
MSMEKLNETIQVSLTGHFGIGRSSVNPDGIRMMSACLPEVKPDNEAWNRTMHGLRTARLYKEILARARPKFNDILNSLVALLCASMILGPLGALLLLNANLQNGFSQSAAASMSEVRRHTEVNPIGLVPSPRTFVLRNEAKTH